MVKAVIRMRTIFVPSFWLGEFVTSVRLTTEPQPTE
jgi:hypothetical protein